MIAGKGDSRFYVESKHIKPLVVEVQDGSDHDEEVQFSHARPADPVDPVEQDSDDDFAELARAARARAKLREESMKKSQTPGVKSPTPGQQVASWTRARSPTPPPDPHVSLLITSRIEGTKPLMVIRKLSQRLQEIRHVWCERQGFSKEFAEGVYLIHRMRRVFDVTTCKSLGLDVDAEGNVTMKGAEGAEGVEKVALEAVTDEIYAQVKAERDREERIRQGLDEAEEEEAQAGASEAVAQPVEPIVRILLISKVRKEPFKLKVKPVRVHPIPAIFVLRADCVRRARPSRKSWLLVSRSSISRKDSRYISISTASGFIRIRLCRVLRSLIWIALKCTSTDFTGSGSSSTGLR